MRRPARASRLFHEGNRHQSAVHFRQPAERGPRRALDRVRAPANTNTYENAIAALAYMDGVQLASQGAVRPVEARFVVEGGTSSMGYLPIGRHHFDLEERTAAGEVGTSIF